MESLVVWLLADLLYCFDGVLHTFDALRVAPPEARLDDGDTKHGVQAGPSFVAVELNSEVNTKDRLCDRVDAQRRYDRSSMLT